MKKLSFCVLIVMLTLTLVGCMGIQVNEYRMGELIDREGINLHRFGDDEGAYLVIQSGSKESYFIVVTRGKEEGHARHVRRIKHTYDKKASTLTLFLEAYVPRFGVPQTTINSNDYFRIFQLSKLPQSIVVIVNDEEWPLTRVHLD